MMIFDLIGTIGDPLTGPLAGGAGKATLLLSGFIRLLTIAAGIYMMINFILGGIGYISSAGNPEGIQHAWQRIYRSMIGLAIVILSFAFAGLLGLLLYGNATAILSPEITGP
ncbi:hypothetical protein IH980_02700 [Patescibacteria group bacterium]|nr:hypothetical protein [Patescibacteria group bacterium]